MGTLGFSSGELSGPQKSSRLCAMLTLLDVRIAVSPIAVAVK